MAFDNSPSTSYYQKDRFILNKQRRKNFQQDNEQSSDTGHERRFNKNPYRK